MTRSVQGGVTMETQRTMIKTFTKVKLKEQKSDFAYWQTQPVEKRLEALEQIRREYHAWNSNSQPRLQRVVSIIKRKRCVTNNDN